jgi:hypothetical protein
VSKESARPTWECANLNRYFRPEPESSLARTPFADEGRFGRRELEAQLANVTEACEPELSEALIVKATIDRRPDEQPLEMALLAERDATDDDRERAPTLRLLPRLRTNAGLVGAVDPLRDDALEFERICSPENIRTISDDMIRESNAWIGTADCVMETRVSLEQWPARQVLAIEPGQIEDLKKEIPLSARPHVAL